jgi:hypothetical protein
MAGELRSVSKCKGYRRFNDSRDMEIMSFELEKEDVMKLKPIYEALHQFLTEEGYGHAIDGGDKVEDLYWERWTPTGAKEQHIWWRLKKDVNPYIRYFIQLNFQSLNVTKAEVAYKNKKMNLEKMDLIIRGALILQWDVDDKFKDSILWKMRKVFFHKLYEEEIQQKKDDFAQFGLRLQRLIKGYFEMATDAQHPKIFQPPMGYKE